MGFRSFAALNRIALISMLGSTVFFSGVNVCVKYLDHIPVHELVFFRSVISLLISIVLVSTLDAPFFGNNRKWLLVRGVFGFTALSLFFFTIKGLPLATATTLQYLSPIFTVIFAIFLIGEKVKNIQWIFFGIAFSGVVIMKGFEPGFDAKYFIMGIISAVCSGVAYNGIMKCRKTDHPFTVVMYFPLVAVPIMGVWTFLDWTAPQGSDWILILVMGVGTQIAQVLMTRALQMETAARITPLKYVGAIYATVLGYTIFDERLSAVTFIGIGLVLAGLLLNSFWKQRKQATS